jgi:hypothetical protein
VIGQGMPRHRHQERLKFLRRIDAETPRHLDVHVITGNYAAQECRGPRLAEPAQSFHMHSTPTLGAGVAA